MQTTHAERRTARLEAVTSLPLGWTTAAPLLCAIHCAAMPVLVAMAPALSKHEIVEVWLLGISVILASGALWFGTRRHGRSVVWIPVSLGLTFWGASLAGLFQPLPEVLTTTGASLTVAGGLIWNSRHLSTSEAAGCHCPVCEDTAGGPE